MVDLGLVVGVFFVSIVPIVLLFLVLHGRGDLIRLWCSNVVPYFKRMKWNKPLRLKVRRDIGQTMNEDIVKLIDSVIFEKGTENKLKDVPDVLAENWKVMRKHPSHYSIWGTFFKRKWKLPNGLGGRWVFMYHLFPLEEMTKRLGRHQLIQGVLLSQPLSVHSPPSKEQWVDARLKEDLAKGIKPDDKRIRAYVKEHRKLSKEKWLNLFFHPTVTVTSEAQMVERLQGFGNFVTIGAYLMRVSGEKLSKYEYYEGYTEHSQKFMKLTQEELHKLADKLGQKDVIIREQDRTIKEFSPPVKINPDHAPMPFYSVPQKEPEKPSKLHVQLPENWISYMLVFLGFASLFWGLLTSGAVQLVVGAFLLVFGAFMLWREGKKLKLPESVKETVSDQKESAMESGA